jgi:hypothetical protein
LPPSFFLALPSHNGQVLDSKPLPQRNLLSISFNLFPNFFMAHNIIYLIWLVCWRTMPALLTAVSQHLAYSVWLMNK